MSLQGYQAFLIYFGDIFRQQQLDEKQRLGISVIAGGIAGAPANIPEAIAQIKQLHPNPQQKPSARRIITKVYQSSGFFGLGKGTLMTVIRSAGLASGYLQVMPMVCEKMRQNISNPMAADLLSAIISGIGVGIITTPPNRLRFLMHKEYLSKQPAPRYFDLLGQEMKSGKLFTGLLPRTGY